MTYRIIYSKEAERDLLSIYDYIEQELKNADAAKRTIGKILSEVEGLDEFPERGGRLFYYLPVEYRFLLANNYVVIYRFSEGKVSVIRVLHKSRDYIKELIQK